MVENIKYQALDAGKIADTILSLSNRINERFPSSGLYGVSQKLLEIGRRAGAHADWIAKPILGLRIGIGFLILFILLGIAGTLNSADKPIRQINLLDLVQVLEAGINDVVLIAIAIFFLVSIERRVKRHRALKAIHELRAIAHIIDMHQLTKDPARLHWETLGIIQPREELTPFQLTRYLDYCSELLSLVGKVSVLYVQKFDDPIALSAVNDVEDLTTGLSRKIWQKMMIIQSNHD